MPERFTVTHATTGNRLPWIVREGAEIIARFRHMGDAHKFADLCRDATESNRQDDDQ